uniref:SFRICE_008531 n=1 Tax=Spodoptera frugiperda TaxID=7108 RepID=A0A2H1WBQ8_SPOFR
METLMWDIKMWTMKPNIKIREIPTGGRHSFFYGIGGKRAVGSLNGKRSALPIDTCNTKGVTGRIGSEIPLKFYVLVLNARHWGLLHCRLISNDN